MNDSIEDNKIQNDNDLGKILDLGDQEWKNES